MKLTITHMFLIIFTLSATQLLAQSVGVNTNNPHASSVMDIEAVDRGLLIPRVALAATNLATPIAGIPANSLLVYNTAYAGVSPNEVVPGYYYWDGLLARWSALKGGGWELTGNTGTNPAINFLGTTDAQDLVIKTNSTEQLRVLSTGEVGVGTPAPTATLDINGTLRLRNAALITAPENTLTVDATGNVHQKAGVTYVGTVYGGDFGYAASPPTITGFFTSATATAFDQFYVFGVLVYSNKDEVQVNFPSLGSTNYIVLITPVCEGCSQSAADNAITPPVIYDRTPSSFKFIQKGLPGTTEDITWHILVTTY